MNKIAIFGAGGFGREVLQIIRDINRIKPTWECEGFLLDPGYGINDHIQGLPVLGGLEWLAQNPEVYVVIAVGTSSERRKIVLRVQKKYANNFATLMHPEAWIGEYIEVGCGSIICAGALLTTDIKIGNHVQINIGCTVGHDVVLQDFVTLNPSVNVSGNVQIGEGSEIGTATVVIPKCFIGPWSNLGAGAVVTKNIGANITAVGVPAKAIKQRPAGWHETIK